MIRPTTENITTLLLLALTVWILYIRHRTRPDTNWPLFYFAAVVAYIRKFDNVIPDWVVFTGVIAALLLRFEFMGGPILKLVKAIESVVMCYIIFCALKVLFG